MKESTLVVCGIAINTELTRVAYIQPPSKQTYLVGEEPGEWEVKISFHGTNNQSFFYFETEEQAYLFYQTIIDEMM